MGKRGIRTREGSRRTEASFVSMVMSMLRSRSMYWKVTHDVLKDAEDGTIINEETGRPNKAVRCALCGHRMPKSAGKGNKPQYAVDHIKPVRPVEGFDSWDGIINRMYCEKDNLQVLCKECHEKKTKAENEARKLHKQRKAGQTDFLK